MAFPYPLLSSVFRQDQAKQLLSQKYSYQNLPRTPCWLDKTPTVGCPVTKSPSKETHNHIPFRAHVWIMPPGLTSQPSLLPDHLLTPVILSSHSLEIHPPSFASAPSRSPTHIRDLVLLCSPGHNPLFLSPKLTESFRVILTTPTSDKLKGFPHWINLSHLNSFMPPIQDNLTHYILTPTGPCPL